MLILNATENIPFHKFMFGKIAFSFSFIQQKSFVLIEKKMQRITEQKLKKSQETDCQEQNGISCLTALDIRSPKIEVSSLHSLWRL